MGASDVGSDVCGVKLRASMCLGLCMCLCLCVTECGVSVHVRVSGWVDASMDALMNVIPRNAYMHCGLDRGVTRHAVDPASLVSGQL